MIADPRQDLAKLKMHARVVGMQFDATAICLNFIFIQHFGQLIELRLVTGIFRMLKHLLRLGYRWPA